MTSSHPSLLHNLRGMPAALWFLCVGAFLNRFGTFVLPFFVIHLVVGAGVWLGLRGGWYTVLAPLGITFAVVPAENASGVSDRYTPFVNYLSKELGIKVNLRVANDYAAVIEGQPRESRNRGNSRDSSRAPVAKHQATAPAPRDSSRITAENATVSRMPGAQKKLLTVLAQRRVRVQSREQLLRDVWEYNNLIDTRTVDTHMRRLREKLGPAAKYLDTVRGVGYRFDESASQAKS